MAYQPSSVILCRKFVLEQNISGFIKLVTGVRDQRIHAFPYGITPEVNVIVRLEFELAYKDIAVQLVCLYATATPLSWKIRIRKLLSTLSPQHFRNLQEYIDETLGIEETCVKFTITKIKQK